MHTTDPITKRFVRFDLVLRQKEALVACALCIALLSPGFVAAQTIDTARFTGITLPEATIRDYRFERTGYTMWRSDSLPLAAPIQLSERLLWENALDVRANAPGTLATISVRGAGPNRSPVIWNGINLLSPMNGVIDAALLTIWPDDPLEIQYGGQSAAHSSGAMGGSVVITQGQQKPDKGIFGALGIAAGSFGHWDSHVETGYSNQKMSAEIRGSWQQADNGFHYRKKGLDGTYYDVKQVNNYAEKADIQQFSQLKLNHRNTLKSGLWLQKAYRELPPLSTESPRETWQKDQAARTYITWESMPHKRIVWTTRLAWLSDRLEFHLPGDTDTSLSRQCLLNTERSSYLGKNWAWRVGAQVIRQWAQVDGYEDSTRWYGQTRLACFTMSEWKKGRTQLSAKFRQEWAQGQAAPFTATLGGRLGMGKAGALQFHGSRNFNLPTLNDRYWKNLGNQELRPEKGFSADIGWSFHNKAWEMAVTGFHLLLNDWILWQPDSTGLFRPGNLRKVWSRGLEARIKWQCLGGNVGQSPSDKKDLRWNLNVTGQVQFSRATNTAVYGGAGLGLGQQLPYTPRASGSLAAHLSRGRFAMAYLHQFRGERLDNGGKILQPFQTGNVLVSCSFLKTRLVVSARVENLWDVQYEIIRYRPMPGLNWRLGLSYRL